MTGAAQVWSSMRPAGSTSRTQGGEIGVIFSAVSAGSCNPTILARGFEGD
jgi:hypothetical protein